MQLMWLSSPLGKMHAVSITKRKVMVAASVFAAACVMVGMALYFVGFRMAVQFRPDLVRAVGGVMTADDVAQRDAEHRTRLAELRDQLSTAEQQLRQLQALKDSFMQMALPKGQAAPQPPSDSKAKLGMGGPRRSLTGSERYTASEPRDDKHSEPPGSRGGDMDGAQEQFARLNDSLARLQTEWQKQLIWLEHIPTGVPVFGKPSFASRFGVRLDPFTRTPARHEGIDFNAPPGTPILATASGIVVRATHDSQYGRMVDIDHGNGYMTRYAHASAIYVKEGQQVKRGTAIAAVGSTGRSTGPHLHYEVHRNGALNPERFLPNIE